jgi:phage terminase large subunit GpA-like protein
MLFDEDGLHRAGRMYLPCAYCGKREWLKVRKATRYDPVNRTEDTYVSIHCENCRLAFGEVDGQPVFENESELIASWNVRAY